MASSAQIAANQLNAQSSTGPRSATGRAASAANATKHGLSSAFFVLPNENRDEFNEVLDGFMAEFQPNGYHETFLVHEMVHARWRVIRIHRLESSYLANAQMEQPAADPDQAILASMAGNGVNILNALSRYAAAAQRTYFKACRELRDGRESSAQQYAAEVRNEAATSRREVAEAENALLAYINAPLPMPIPCYDFATRETKSFSKTNPIHNAEPSADPRNSGQSGPSC